MESYGRGLSMEDKQPTESEIEELWKWCGFKEVLSRELWQYEKYRETNHWWEAPSGRKFLELPELDLNNLFEYAVPKLQPEVIEFVPVTGVKEQFDYGQKWGCLLILKGWAVKKSVISNNPNPALVLFWAIWKVIHNGR
jgi:hypothetical protein